MSSTSGTKAANSRIYHLPLQYRTGNDGEFTDLVDGQGNPAEYRPQDENHTRTFGPLPLPQELMGQERVEQMFWRSEEHTSELQSRGHLVCRLLLEKN